MPAHAWIGHSGGIGLRRFAASDLDDYRRWLQPEQEWHRWDGPYSPKPGAAEIDALLERRREEIERGAAAAETPAVRALIVAVDEPTRMLGMVSWHWEAEESDWRRVGVTVFDPDARGRGIGTESLRIWTDHLFATTDIVRLDFSTWSGNTRMLGVGHRLGWREEARFRDAREVRGERYDSVVMGVLRREWAEHPVHATLAE